MLHVWMIVLLGSVVLHDGVLAPARADAATPGQIAWIAAAAMLIAMAVIVIITHVVCWASTRLMDRRGSWRAVRSAERMIMAGQILAVITHVFGVLVGGWVEVVRQGLGLGDLIVIDEIVCVLPAILVIACGWWSFYPIERRLRETVWLRVLEDGHPLYPTPTRWQFVISNIRHQVLLTMVPLVMIGAWSETVDRVLAWFARQGSRSDSGVFAHAGTWLRQSPDNMAMLSAGGRLVGVACVLVISSLVMRYIWETVRLGDGPMRDRLIGLCDRAGVRVRELLVWRTRGTMVNGAAMGLIGPLRYILLTDALLDHLPAKQVESVMAHEIAHAKHHHIPWLLCSLLGAVGVLGAMFGASAWGLAIWLAPGALEGRVVPPWWLVNAELLLVVPTLVGTFLAFGWISRRFEWQADAFAAQRLSDDSVALGTTDAFATEPRGQVVTQESVDAMIGALDSVAQLNHIPVRRRSFRHGSIAARQSRLRSLVGLRIGTLPIDRQVRWIKRGVACAVMLTIAAIAIEWMMAKPRNDARGSVVKAEESR
ncbi:MAG: M48 family metalloprotease [Phycisphaerales bacterium]|nr:M48 family metalloprotease [Phycisphaerales bacterium]